MNRYVSGHEEWAIGKIAPIITFEITMRRFSDESPEQILLNRSEAEL